LKCITFYNNPDTIINHKAFSYNTKIYIKYDCDITDHIHILKSIDDLLPMPIAEEIIPNIKSY
jgi:hypothetical protein